MAYGMFLCAGLLPWAYFTELLGRCPNLFIDHANLLKKVNFPRVILPVVLFLSTSINFIIIFGIFLIFLGITNRFPGWSILGYIPLLVIQQLFVLGLGLSLGILNVFFRDIGQIIGITLQFWFWFTPIVYPITVLSERVRNIIELNPMTSFTVAYQRVILHNSWPQLTSFWFHIISTIAVWLLGYLLFHKLSGDIMDEL
jgi:lipopolysaccharide transport system permease protein